MRLRGGREVLRWGVKDTEMWLQYSRGREVLRWGVKHTEMWLQYSSATAAGPLWSLSWGPTAALVP
jgi:hypothetical protein